MFEQSAERENALAFTPTEAACAAHAVVRDLGASRLQELGLDVPSRRGPELTEPPLRAEEADLVFAAFADCVDLVAQIGATIAADSGLPADVADCVAAAYVESGVLRESLLARDFNGSLNGRIDAVLAEAAEACTAT